MCDLDPWAPIGTSEASTLLDSQLGYFGWSSLSIAAPLTTTGSTVDIDCSSNDAGTDARDTHLIAINVGSVSGT